MLEAVPTPRRNIAVQPDNIVAQTESSVVYGLGFALSERITIRDGAVLGRRSLSPFRSDRDLVVSSPRQLLGHKTAEF